MIELIKEMGRGSYFIPTFNVLNSTRILSPPSFFGLMTIGDTYLLALTLRKIPIANTFGIPRLFVKHI
jgi:hypothetical protein